jgi:hypothetical protein
LPIRHDRLTSPSKLAMQTPQRAARSAASTPAQGSGSCSLPHRLPSNATQQHRPLTLHEVDRVLVSSAASRRQGATSYTLEVYTASSSSAISPQDFSAKLSEDRDEAAQKAPACRVDKTLADFDALRRALYSASNLAHTSVACEFCKEVILYIDSGDRSFGGSVLRRLVGRDKVVRSLQEFLDDVLAILTHFASIEDTPWCSAQVQSHQVVRQFLLPRAPDS